MLSIARRTPPPPRAGAAEVAPGVQIALQTSPQRPRTQPPPGGPSGKLERDSAGRPGAARAGAKAEPSHMPPSPALPAQKRGVGVGVGVGLDQPQNRTEPAAQRKAEVKRLALRSPLQPPNLKTPLSDHPGSGGKVGRGQPYRPPSQETRAGRSFQMSVSRTDPPPNICRCLLEDHGTSPTPRTPSDS